MLSILIPNYNYDCSELLYTLAEQCLALRQAAGGADGPFDYEVIVGDDGSTDVKSLCAVRDTAAHVGAQLLELPVNGGRARMRNALMEAARMPYLLILDSDMLPRTSDFVRDIWAERHKADVVCARLVNPLGEPEGSELRCRYEKATEPKRTAEYRNARPFSSVATYCLLMRRAALGDLRFDECCTEYGYEDVLFGQELRRRYISIYHTDVPILHTGIDSNESFLKKTEAAMRTLTTIAPKLDELPGAALYYNELKKKGMDWLPSVAYRLFGGMMRGNLLGRHPSLKIFHLYKLCYFAYLMRR